MIMSIEGIKYEIDWENYWHNLLCRTCAKTFDCEYYSAVKDVMIVISECQFYKEIEKSIIQKRCEKCNKPIKGKRCSSYNACMSEIEDW